MKSGDVLIRGAGLHLQGVVQSVHDILLCRQQRMTHRVDSKILSDNGGTPCSAELLFSGPSLAYLFNRSKQVGAFVAMPAATQILPQTSKYCVVKFCVLVASHTSWGQHPAFDFSEAKSG